MSEKKKPEMELMILIDTLTQESLDIPHEKLVEEAEKRGLQEIEGPLEQLKQAGLVAEENGIVTKIVKRLFW